MNKIDPKIAIGAAIVALLILGLSIYFSMGEGTDNAALSKELPPPPANSQTFSLPPSVHVLGKDRGPKNPAAAATDFGGGTMLRRPSVSGGGASASAQ